MPCNKDPNYCYVLYATRTPNVRSRDRVWSPQPSMEGPLVKERATVTCHPPRYDVSKPCCTFLGLPYEDKLSYTTGSSLKTTTRLYAGLTHLRISLSSFLPDSALLSRETPSVRGIVFRPFILHITLSWIHYHQMKYQEIMCLASD